MLLNTERLTLRLPEQSDVPAYLAICNSDFVLRFNAMPVKKEHEISAAFQEALDEENLLILERKIDGTIIGAVFIEEDSIRWGVGSKELSYFLGEKFARSGYMKEALKEVIRYLFEDKKVACIGARAFVPNVASRRLLESLGFCKDGIIPHCVKGYGDIIYDDTLYSIFPSYLK